MQKIYETIIYHDDNNKSLVTTDNGFRVGVAPVKDADLWHTNPEQLIGASWAACLKATIDSIIKARKLTNKSKVNIKVTLLFDPKTRYEFKIEGFAAIENLNLEDAQRIVKSAHRLCPVSKLIGNNESVTLTTVNYWPASNLSITSFKRSGLSVIIPSAPFLIKSSIVSSSLTVQ